MFLCFPVKEKYMRLLAVRTSVFLCLPLNDAAGRFKVTVVFVPELMNRR